ncbi:MAG: hypothetical protein LBR20_09110 [Propionibacteriaceae bacterium]|nr:hypothetical protein [Propionibacteriaceae bacterium]
MIRVFGALFVVALLAGCAPEAAPPSPSVTVSETPTVTLEPSEEPEPGPTATRTTTLAPEEQYCADWVSILATPESTGESDDEAGEGDDAGDAEDYTTTAAWAAETAQKYEWASENAPEELKAKYDEVVDYLRAVETAAASNDEETLYSLFEMIGDLDDAMTAIQETTEALCGVEAPE